MPILVDATRRLKPPRVLAITEGRLGLGPWEQVFYAEFDGRRRKRVLLKAIGE